MDTRRPITEAQVNSWLNMPATIQTVRAALIDQAADRAVNVPRQRLRLGSSMMHILAASWEARGVFGHKSYASSPKGVEFYVILYYADGRPGVVIEANRLGQLRTGAATGVASKALARPDSKVLGVIGSGYQMRTQVEAVVHELPIERVQVWSPTEANREAFARELGQQLAVEMVAVDSVEAATDGADVINVLTTSPEPLLYGRHLQPGVHVNAAGSNRVQQQEIAADVFTDASLVVTDDLEQAHSESGDLVAAVSAGTVDWSDVKRLADVVAYPPQREADAVTVFKSHGIGLWDVAAALKLLEELDG